MYNLKSNTVRGWKRKYDQQGFLKVGVGRRRIYDKQLVKKATEKMKKQSLNVRVSDFDEMMENVLIETRNQHSDDITSIPVPSRIETRSTVKHIVPILDITDVPFR